MIDLASLFRAYNAAKQSRRFHPQRLNKALGIAMRRTTRVLDDQRIDVTGRGSDWHLASIKNCTCEDYLRHGRGQWWCKHKIAAALLYRAYQLQGGSSG